MLKRAVIAVVLAGFVLAGGSVPAWASEHDKCEHRIHKAEQNLDKAVRRHGEHSRQAEERREELRRVRHDCRMDEHEHEHEHM